MNNLLFNTTLPFPFSKKIFWTLFLCFNVFVHHNLFAFPGFLIEQEGHDIKNRNTHMILAHHEGLTTVTLMVDYLGESTQFALILFVPGELISKSVKTTDKNLFDRISAFSTPRLVEVSDSDPCKRNLFESSKEWLGAVNILGKKNPRQRGNIHPLPTGIDPSYEEYQFTIFPVEIQDLTQWLVDNGYILSIKTKTNLLLLARQGINPIVVKVKLNHKPKGKLTFLQPIQYSYKSDHLNLPIQLGTANAFDHTPQNIHLYFLTRSAQIRSINYPTKQIPSDIEIPDFIKNNFSKFYETMFNHQTRERSGKTLWIEYTGNASWCKSCTGDPLSAEEFIQAGVSWLSEQKIAPRPLWKEALKRRPAAGALPVILTRYHFQYTDQTFSDAIEFEETRDQNEYATRYIIHKPWRGPKGNCEEAEKYGDRLNSRREKEINTLSEFTGQSVQEINERETINQPEIH